jgi:hypothetical protein
MKMSTFVVHTKSKPIVNAAVMWWAPLMVGQSHSNHRGSDLSWFGSK